MSTSATQAPAQPRPQTFCAIDFETANPQRGSVCAIGLAKFDAVTGQLIASDGGLIRPPKGLDHFAPMNMRVHHISPRKIEQARNGQGAITWDVVLPWMVAFVGSDLLVAHNAAFERSVIRSASEAMGLAVPSLRVACTVKIAKRELPALPQHKLPAVAAHLGVPQKSHHDAADDALVCGGIMAALLQRTSENSAAGMNQMILRSGQRLRDIVVTPTGGKPSLPDRNQRGWTL